MDAMTAAFVKEMENVNLAEGDNIDTLESKLIDLYHQRRQVLDALQQTLDKKGAKDQEEKEEFEKVLATVSQMIFKLEKDCGCVRDVFVKSSETRA